MQNASMQFELKSKQAEMGNVVVEFKGDDFSGIFSQFLSARRKWAETVANLPATASRARKSTPKKTDEVPDAFEEAVIPEAHEEPQKSATPPAIEAEKTPVQAETPSQKAAKTRQSKNELNRQAVVWAERIKAVFPEDWSGKEAYDVMTKYSGMSQFKASSLDENGWNKMITCMKFAITSFIKDQAELRPERVQAINGFMALAHVIDNSESLEDYEKSKKEVVDSGILETLPIKNQDGYVFPEMWNQILSESLAKKKAFEVAALVTA